MNSKILNGLQKVIYLIEDEIANSTTEEDKKKHKFRLNHIKNAVRYIKKYPKEITSTVELKGIYGFGKGILSRIDEILKTGNLQETKNVSEKDITKELTKVINIGTTTANNLIKKYNITNVNELMQKINNKEIVVNDKILIGLKYYNKIEKKIPRNTIIKFNSYIDKLVYNIDKDLICYICGSFRRELPYSGDIDILLSHPKPVNDLYMVHFIEKLKEKKLLLEDKLAYSKYKFMGFLSWENIICRLDIRYIDYTSLPTALLYFTGSYELNTKMRKIAKKKGYKLNEYGLYDHDKPFIITSEKDVFDKLDMVYLEPKERNL